QEQADACRTARSVVGQNQMVPFARGYRFERLDLDAVVRRHVIQARRERSVSPQHDVVPAIAIVESARSTEQRSLDTVRIDHQPDADGKGVVSFEKGDVP